MNKAISETCTVDTVPNLFIIPLVGGIENWSGSVGLVGVGESVSESSSIDSMGNLSLINESSGIVSVFWSSGVSVVNLNSSCGVTRRSSCGS